MTAADRAALTDALTVASAGPSPPPIERLRAAAEYVIDRAKPDQVILFGSASRGEFSTDSDFDFLVVHRPRTADARPAEIARWTHPETGDRLDAIIETPEAAAERRWLLGTPESVIFVDGATVYTAPGTTPIRTLRDEGRQAEMTSTKLKWNPRKATNLIIEARAWLKAADSTAEDDVWGVACKHLQESAERAIKAIIVAADKPFGKIHDLNELWTAAHTADGEIPLERVNRALTQISEYGGPAGYDDEVRHEDPEKLFQDFRPTAGALLEYAEKRVRARLAEYERTRKTDRPAR